MRNYAGMCKGICSYNLVYNFLIQLLPLQTSVFAVTFWHSNEAFPKGSSYNEIIPLLLIFHLRYSKYRVVKICSYSCRYQDQNFSLVSFTFVSFVQHSCRTRVVCVALMSHSCFLCSTRVALVSFVQHSCRSCRICVARVWQSCCKLDQITKASMQSHFSLSSHIFAVNGFIILHY